MRNFFFMLVLIPLFGISQTKNVVSTQRVFPKADKVLEFEKALAAHAQKYHKGDFQWRVYEIESGPDFGGYHITEGPASWTSFDGRGNLGTEHNNDWNRTVAIYITDRGSSSYSQFDDTLSTVKLTDYADKIIINHIMPKPGMINNLRAMVSKMKKAWTAGNESVAVYTSVFSGEPQLAIVTRLKGGLKELELNYRKPLPDRYNDANGTGSWDQYLKDYAMNVSDRWSELLFLRTDLSSK
jgi:hypothetical protein